MGSAPSAGDSIIRVRHGLAPAVTSGASSSRNGPGEDSSDGATLKDADEERHEQPDRLIIECRRPSMKLLSEGYSAQRTVFRGRRLSVELSEMVLGRGNGEGEDNGEDHCYWESMTSCTSAATSEPVTPRNVVEAEVQHTVFIFDWDDTLLPTSAAVQAGWNGEVAQEDIPVLNAHASLVLEVLRTCRNFGAVAIVTLAKKPWVTFTAEKYLPGINWKKEFREMGIPIIYARDSMGKNFLQRARKEEGVDLFVRSKTCAMARALKKLRKIGMASSDKLTLISIGDSSVEAEAAMEVAWSQDTDCPCTTLKLKEQPLTIDELKQQLQDVLTWIQSLSWIGDEIDQNVEFDDEYRSHLPPSPTLSKATQVPDSSLPNSFSSNPDDGSLGEEEEEKAGKGLQATATLAARRLAKGEEKEKAGIGILATLAAKEKEAAARLPQEP